MPRQPPHHNFQYRCIEGPSLPALALNERIIEYAIDVNYGDTELGNYGFALICPESSSMAGDTFHTLLLRNVELASFVLVDSSTAGFHTTFNDKPAIFAVNQT